MTAALAPLEREPCVEVGAQLPEIGGAGPAGEPDDQAATVAVRQGLHDGK
jgi:hypothetical protein